MSGGTKLPSGEKAAGAVPGDTVKVRIKKAKKSSAEAEAMEKKAEAYKK